MTLKCHVILHHFEFYFHPTSIPSELVSALQKTLPLGENSAFILPLHNPLHYPLQQPLTFILSILCFKRNKNIKFNFSNFKYNICIKDFGCFLKAYTGEQYIRRLNSPVRQ